MIVEYLSEVIPHRLHLPAVRAPTGVELNKDIPVFIKHNVHEVVDHQVVHIVFFVSDLSQRLSLVVLIKLTALVVFDELVDFDFINGPHVSVVVVVGQTITND